MPRTLLRARLRHAAAIVRSRESTGRAPIPHAIVFGGEVLASEGAPGRFWCGPFDPASVVVPIGLVRLDLSGSFEIGATRRLFVTPAGRARERLGLDTLFRQLTGIAETCSDGDGLSLTKALAETGASPMARGRGPGARTSSTCLPSVAMSRPARRFGTACPLMLKSGTSCADIRRTASNHLARLCGVDLSGRRDHDAPDDALSVAAAHRHLLRGGALVAKDFF